MHVSRADEGLHPPGPGPRWAESWTFDFASGNGSVAGWVRLTRQPALRRSWYHAFLARPGRQLVAVDDADAPEVDRTLEFRTTGLWAAHICETPFDHWTIGLEAFGLGVDDPAELYGRQLGDRVPLGFDLEWEALGPPDEAGTAVARYGQACRVTGEVLVGDEVVDLDGHGRRSRQWGDWQGWETPWFDGHARLADGTVVAATVTADDLPAAVAQVGGRPAAVRGLSTAMRAPGIPDEAHVELDGTTIRWVPVVVTPVELQDGEGRRTRAPRALCRVHVSDGRAGWGWAEWNEPQR